MATDQQSSIFNDLISSYSAYSDYDHLVSEDPLDGEFVYIHHRINKSSSIPENSIVFIHHDLDDIDPAFSLLQYLNPIKKTSAAICLNSSQANVLISNGYRGQIHIIPHGYVATDEALTTFAKIRNFKTTNRSSSKTTRKKHNLVINSRRYLRAVKGESYLRRLFQDLDQNVFSWTFLGTDRLIDSLAARRNNFSIRYIQPQNYVEVVEGYQHADLLLNLSWYEGGPANVPEAIMTQTPIFTRRIGMAVDVLPETYLGYFSDYDDLLEILQKWVQSSTFRQNINEQIKTASLSLSTQKGVARDIDVVAKEIFTRS